MRRGEAESGLERERRGQRVYHGRHGAPRPADPGPRRPLPALELPLLHHVQHFPGNRAWRRAAVPAGTARPLRCQSISSPPPAPPPRLCFLRAFSFPPARSLCKAGSDGDRGGGGVSVHIHTHTHTRMHARMQGGRLSAHSIPPQPLV